MPDDYVMPTNTDGSPMYPDLDAGELARVLDCVEGMRAASRLNESDLGMLLTRAVANYRAQKAEIARLQDERWTDKQIVGLIDTVAGAFDSAITLAGYYVSDRAASVEIENKKRVLDEINWLYSELQAARDEIARLKAKVESMKWPVEDGRSVLQNSKKLEE